MCLRGHETFAGAQLMTSSTVPLCKIIFGEFVDIGNGNFDNIGYWQKVNFEHSWCRVLTRRDLVDNGPNLHIKAGRAG